MAGDKSVLFLCIIIITLVLLACYTYAKYITDPHGDIAEVKNFHREKNKAYTEVLRRAAKVLNKMKIPFFLSSGTCLGYFRENDFIAHDYDIDLGIMADDYQEEFIAEMRKAGFVHYRTFGDINTGMELSFRLPGTMIGRYAKLDVFTHHPETINGSQYLYWITYEAPMYQKRIKYRVPKFSFKKTIFKGVEVLVPNPTKDYIVNHYGADWKTPRKIFIDYSYSRSPVSIVRDE